MDPIMVQLGSIHDLNAAFDEACTDAKPRLLFKGGGMTTLYLNVPEGGGMPVHDHPGCQVTVVCMVGEANVVLEGAPNRLRAGELITFSGVHQVEPRNGGSGPCGMLILLAETGG